MKSMKHLVVISNIIFLCVICNTEANWYNTNWQYREQITISSSMMFTTNQTKFPLLIRRASDSNLASCAQSNGDEILFTSLDGSTKLDHEIEKYVSSTGELWACVRIPTLPTGTATIIYMYYGNATTARQQNATGVLNFNFKGVWHLKETSGGSGAIKDSTFNVHNGTDTNSPNLRTTGQIGNAISFDGTNDYIDVGAQAALRPTTFTHSFLIKSSSTDVSDVIISIYDTSTGPTAEYGVIDRTNHWRCCSTKVGCWR
jgi:hypothetical protein